MNKIKAMLAGVSALLASMAITTPSVAGSSDFAGPYIALQASVNGLSLSGQTTDNNNEVNTGTAGKFIEVAGGEIGYAIPVGDSFLLNIGVVQVSGSGSMTGDTGPGAGTDITVDVGDHITGYIQPTIAISETSALFVKAGISRIDISATGDVDTPSVPGSLAGNVIAMGSRTMFGNGAFIQFEGGIRTYDELKIFGGGSNQNGLITADPKIAYGAMTLGYKF